jgi:hypothetical protein
VNVNRAADGVRENQVKVLPGWPGGQTLLVLSNTMALQPVYGERRQRDMAAAQ